MVWVMRVVTGGVGGGYWGGWKEAMALMDSWVSGEERSSEARYPTLSQRTRKGKAPRLCWYEGERIRGFLHCAALRSK